MKQETDYGGITTSRPASDDIADAFAALNFIMPSNNFFCNNLCKQRIILFLNIDFITYALALSPGQHALPSPPRTRAHSQNTQPNELQTQTQGCMT